MHGPGPGAVQSLPPDFGVGAAECGNLEGVAVGQGASVGVDVGVGKYRDYPVAHATRPIYRVGGREVNGTWHGPTAGKQPGSIGSSAYPSRVIKGKRLPGRMGGVNLTVKNLEVVAVDADQNVLMLRGAVPGPPNGLVIVRKRGD